MAAVMQASRPFMSVKQVAEYLQLNEKKIYSLVHDGAIPATKVTGKWMFPRELVDRWMLDSAHGGLLSDRLVIAGSDDPLLYRLVLLFAQETGSRALISYTPTGTRLGLELLQSGRADLCGLHWGPDGESRTRHPALLQQYDGHRHWILIHAFRREQGILLRDGELAGKGELEALFEGRVRWALRQKGAGAQRYFLEILSRLGLVTDSLERTATAYSERDAAAAVAMGQADAAPVPALPHANTALPSSRWAGSPSTWPCPGTSGSAACCRTCCSGSSPARLVVCRNSSVVTTLPDRVNSPGAKNRN